MKAKKQKLQPKINKKLTKTKNQKLFTVEQSIQDNNIRIERDNNDKEKY